MFETSDGVVDLGLERRRAARRCELRSLYEQEARIKQRVMQIVREADDDGDCRAAGCTSSAQWLAQLSSSDHRSALRITRTSGALRSLPALDHALSTGTLTLDQVAAAAEFATPESDAEFARVAVGKAPTAARRRTLRTGAAVGLSTCAPFSGDQNLSFGLSESRRPPHLVGADPRQRCDDRKRPVDATCTRTQPRTKCRVRQRDLRALHARAGEPSESRDPLHGRSGDHRAHFDGCQRVERPRPPNQATTTLGTPKRQVLAS
jgi:hypothetical protein